MAWLWIASLFLATVGVSVQQIYCYCLGKTSVSLFATNDDCAKKIVEEKSCCTKPDARPTHKCCKNGGESEKKHGCTHKTTKVFQLKTEFTFGDKTPVKPSPTSADFLHPAFPQFAFSILPSAEELPVSVFAEPPPPLSGRMICVRYGIFRC